MAAEKLGGWPRLVAWVEKDEINERIFWSQVYPKLLPLQVAGDINMRHTVVETLKAMRGDAE